MAWIVDVVPDVDGGGDAIVSEGRNVTVVVVTGAGVDVEAVVAPVHEPTSTRPTTARTAVPQCLIRRVTVCRDVSEALGVHVTLVQAIGPPL